MKVERDHVGIFGKMNAGKSSVMNLLVQQNLSIVDSKPGTTADTKIALQEIHGIGPVKIFDTAGCDEAGKLGEKKKKKMLNDLKECDLVLLVINPGQEGLEAEREILKKARELKKQVLFIYNIFDFKDKEKIGSIEKQIELSRFYKKIVLRAVDEKDRKKLLDFILDNYRPKNLKIELLPFLEKDQFYVLNIPMDEETPEGRYLRPQLMVEEYITRNWAYPVSFRMNLREARGGNSKKEKQRFLNFLNSLKRRPKAIITDSQAMDIMKKWTPEDIDLTTFSIVMINDSSGGRLGLFVEGVKAVDDLKAGDKVLIAEACNHSRIAEDIGTVQIPEFIKKKYPGVIVEYNFGREFQENEKLKEYKLIIHCGGCMIAKQKLSARLRDLSNVGVPITNYGIFLSYIQGQKSFNKVLKPWGIVL